MKIDRNVFDNRVLDEQALSLDRPRPPVADGVPVNAGYFYTDQGDILLRIYAANAREVKVKILHPAPVRELILCPGADGVFEGIVHYDPGQSGPLNIDVFFDGNFALYPYFPIGWCGNRPNNYIDMPSPHASLWEIRDVPHGTVSSELYYSSVMQDWKRCMVYTPPGYMKGDGQYPVVYMLHGGTANEQDWLSSGRISHIFDNLFASGKATPFIAVMANGMVRFPDSGTVVWDDALEQMLVRDIIPYIDTWYRTLDDKWNRALCGLSMGSYMTNDIGFRHPDLFGYMGQFTACMTHLKDFPNYERPYLALMQAWEKDPSEFSRRYRIFFRSTTRREDHFDYFEADDAILAKAGIDTLPCNHRTVYSDQTSKWDSWRLGIHDYVQLLFK